MGHSLSGCPTGMEDAKLGTRLGSLKQLSLGISVFLKDTTNGWNFGL